MNPESRFEGADPAKHLLPLDHESKQHLATSAQHAETLHDWPHPRRTKTIAIAAIAVLALAIPLAGQFNHSGKGNRLEIAGLAQNGGGAESASLAGKTGMGMVSDKMMGGYGGYMMWWNPPKIVLDTELSTAGTAADAYEISVPVNADKQLQEIAGVLGFGELTHDNQSTTDYKYDAYSAQIGSYEDQTSKRFDGWISQGWAIFNFYDQNLDPWSLCYKYWGRDENGTSKSEIDKILTDPRVTISDGGVSPDNPDGSTCRPAEFNAPSDAAMKAAAISWLQKFGISTQNLKWNMFSDNYSASASAVLLVDGIESPLYWYFSFTADLKLVNASGSLQQLTNLGSYDLISPAAALERYNEQMQIMKQKIEEQQKNDATAVPGEPGKGGSTNSNEGSSSGSSGSGEVTAEPAPVPSASDGTEPIDPGTIEPLPEPTPVDYVAHVTGAKRGMQFVTAKDGRLLWIPTWEFVGYFESDDSKFETTIASVIAVVDDQIDLSDFYNFLYGGYGLATDMVVRK